jgi:hypothetical protein
MFDQEPIFYQKGSIIKGPRDYEYLIQRIAEEGHLPDLLNQIRRTDQKFFLDLYNRKKRILQHRESRNRSVENRVLQASRLDTSLNKSQEKKEFPQISKRQQEYDPIPSKHSPVAKKALTKEELDANMNAFFATRGSAELKKSQEREKSGEYDDERHLFTTTNEDLVKWYRHIFDLERERTSFLTKVTKSSYRNHLIKVCLLQVDSARDTPQILRVRSCTSSNSRLPLSSQPLLTGCTDFPT